MAYCHDHLLVKPGRQLTLGESFLAGSESDAHRGSFCYRGRVGTFDCMRPAAHRLMPRFDRSMLTRYGARRPRAQRLRMLILPLLAVLPSLAMAQDAQRTQQARELMEKVGPPSQLAIDTFKSAGMLIARTAPWRLPFGSINKPSRHAAGNSLPAADA